MLSSVLNSERAIRVNIEIMRAFVRFRGILDRNDGIEEKLRELEARVESRMAKQDVRIAALFEAIRRLMQKPSRTTEPESPKRIAGFHSREDGKKAGEAKRKTTKKS